MIAYTIKEIKNADLKTINKIIMDTSWCKPFLMRECFDRALVLGYKEGYSDTPAGVLVHRIEHDSICIMPSIY